MQTSSDINVNLVINFTLVLVAMVLMLFVLFYVFNKKLRQQKNESINYLLISQQNERGRIARDLHDRMGTLLADIIYTIDDISLTNPPSGMLNKENAKRKAAIAMDTMRDIANDMMPETINTFGLVYTIEKLIANPPQGITIHFTDNTFHKTFGTMIENHLYSIILELIQNTINHSGANELDIELYYNSKKNELDFTYYDNGHGFNDKAKTEGNGLKNIKTRAAIIKGLININGDNEFNLSLNIKL